MAVYRPGGQPTRGRRRGRAAPALSPQSGPTCPRPTDSTSGSSGTGGTSIEMQRLDDEGLLTPFEFTGRTRPKVAATRRRRDPGRRGGARRMGLALRRTPSWTTDSTRRLRPCRSACSSPASAARSTTSVRSSTTDSAGTDRPPACFPRRGRPRCGAGPARSNPTSSTAARSSGGGCDSPQWPTRSRSGRRLRQGSRLLRPRLAGRASWRQRSPRRRQRQARLCATCATQSEEEREAGS